MAEAARRAADIAKTAIRHQPEDITPVYNRDVMTPLAQWLKPPRSLLLILFLLTLVSVSALAWFGWRLLDQDRMAERQRVRERLEQAADGVAASLRGTLAEMGDRLSTGSLHTPPRDGLLLLFDDDRIAAVPAERLLYTPVPASWPEAKAGTFDDAERLEFAEKQPAAAAAIYRGLAASSDLATRAGALVRLARASRNEAAGAYRGLSAISAVDVAGAPADLVARLALCDLTENRAEATALRRDLLNARWQLTRGQFEFYWRQTTRLAGQEEPPPPEPMAFSEAAALVWQDRQGEARVTRTIWVEGRPLLLIRRESGAGKAALLTEPAAILNQACASGDVLCAIADGEGRLLAGPKTRAPQAVVRTAAESGLPWTLYIAEIPGREASAMLARQRFLLLGTFFMVAFLVACTYFIARAIRREADVARVQSEFVSTVSHEFRSPLTSLRQLSEILALGRVPSEDRRQLYYENLVRETARLQRLVEALLNFGRMEAGARQYRFEELETADLVRRVAAEFSESLAASGRRIELNGPAAPCPIQADPEAMSVALRNLVDNALKYSGNQPVVWVAWGRENGRVAIRVRDAGAGIPAAERKAIFRKFVRGSAALAGNVKGSGVGLAMVQHIVAAHGGEISVESELNKGSTFILKLPALVKL